MLIHKQSGGGGMVTRGESFLVLVSFLFAEKKFMSTTTRPPRKRTSHLNKIIDRNDALAKMASERAAMAQNLLLPDTPGMMIPLTDMDQTTKVSQAQIRASEQVDDNTRAKMLNLTLNDTYRIKFTNNGRHMVMGSSKGHLALIDALRATVTSELQLGQDEHVHDVTPLHNYTFFAAAQKKYVYMYDETGVEVHQLRSHIEPLRLSFLLHHMLLASVGRGGYLKYQDVSTGDLVASIRTRLGPCHVLAQNPASAVLCTGHLNGTVQMWAPSQGSTALVKMLCHKGPVVAAGFDRQGLRLVTCGMDERVCVWDARMFGKEFSYHATPRPATHVAISQRGLMAWGMGNDVTVFGGESLFSKAQSPYMTHRLPAGCEVAGLEFRPYEDVLGIGHSQGVQTVIVPGAGEANFDTYEANPFERANQRRETEVHRLLDKLPFDTIGMSLPMGAVSSVAKEVREEEVAKKLDAAKAKKKLLPLKKKMKGRGKIGSRLKTKHRNIWTMEREMQRDSEKKRKLVLLEDAGGKEESDLAPGERALKRFG
jgi:U3 small nucleolar RNA-associated protein 7